MKQDYTPNYTFISLTIRDSQFPNAGQQHIDVEPVINDDELFEANQVINYIKGLK